MSDSHSDLRETKAASGVPVGLPIEKVERDLAAYARDNGIDLDAMLESAGQHFQGDSFPDGPVEPLADFEIEALCADDLANWHPSPDGIFEVSTGGQ